MVLMGAKHIKKVMEKSASGQVRDGERSAELVTDEEDGEHEMCGLSEVDPLLAIDPTQCTCPTAPIAGMYM